MIYVLSVALGIGLLTLGGEALIKGALGAAERLGISALLAGLVIVGFGTSAPELVVSIDAAINQQPDIAVGNVIGSNIGNLLLILGLCALITPLAAKPEALRRDGLMMLLATLLVVVLAWGSALNRLDAFILLAALISYLIWAYRTERQGELASAQLHAAEASEVTRKPQRTLYIVLFIVAGLACLIIGSQVLLSGAVGIAQHFGVSEALIGLSLVAVGTSLPELSISVLAALRRHADVAIGNILGSNIFNILGILGISALLQPLPMAARIISFDQWVMLGVTLVALLFLLTGKRLSRLEGAALLAGYIVYMWLSFTVV
ncbi:sodium:calcium antiporter [Aliidiomarina maris]|uniref:Sodium:calcium antiporter n=1 Tax=Aliidiomarina maris TaxID=531312 RepID=A0ABY0BU12_9GAMM|nr:sodium:calcium antiporter [Aliidiomarina maris]